jgi:transposase-like protein
MWISRVFRGWLATTPGWSPDAGGEAAQAQADLDVAKMTVRPDRARCTGCAATHVLLDAALVARHGYTAPVVGHALVRAARGEPHREIADRLDAPVGTVRGWIRGARRSAHQLWTLGVAAVVALDQNALPARERSDPLTAALDVLAAAAFAMRRAGSVPRSVSLGRGSRS